MTNEMVTTVMDFAETVKKVEEMKANAEANIALANQLKENIAALQKSVEQDIATYKNKTCHHLTANQKRARAIEMAKEFVEDQKSCGLYNLKKSGTVYHCYAEFIRKNNRITCLLKGSIFSNIYSVGRAECHVDDVFNEHIGRAVALAKALDIVEQLPPDILKAVQPDEMVKGHIILSTTGEQHEIIERNWKGECYVDDFSYYLDGALRSGLKIVDDTSADYASLQGGEN